MDEIIPTMLEKNSEDLSRLTETCPKELLVVTTCFLGRCIAEIVRDQKLDSFLAGYVYNICYTVFSVFFPKKVFRLR